MKTKDLMTDAVCISKEDTLGHARRLMLRFKCRHLLVMDDGKLAGILTLSDILSRMREGTWRRRPIEKILVGTTMNPTPQTTSPDSNYKTIIKTMLERDISGIPVVDGDEVQGIVTKEPLLRYFLDNFKGKFRVKDLMTAEVVTVKPAHTLGHARNVLTKEGRSRVVVEHDGRPVGVLSTQDIFFSPFKQAVPYVGDLMGTVRCVSPDDDAADVAADMLKNGEFCLPVFSDRLAGVITRTDYLKALR